jgi:hypothetical protein
MTLDYIVFYWVVHYTSIDHPHFVEYHGSLDESGETDIVREFIDVWIYRPFLLVENPD